MTRLTPKVFSDPFAGASSVEGGTAAWPKALKQLPGALDAWSFAPSDLGSFLEQRDPQTACLILTNAAATLNKITKGLSRRGFEKKSTPSALRQAEASIKQALAPANLGHASEAEVGLIKDAMRALLTALKPHANQKNTETVLETLQAALSTDGAAKEIEDVFFSESGDEIFEEAPQHPDSPLRVLHEGEINETQIAALFKLAADRPVQLVDIEADTFSHLWEGPDSKIRCDDANLVSAHSDKFTLGKSGTADDIEGLLQTAGDKKLPEAHLRLETNDALECFDASLIAASSITTSKAGLDFTIRNNEGQAQLTARGGSANRKLRLPAVPKERLDEVVGVIENALQDSSISELTFGGVGFARDASGLAKLKLPTGTELRQVSKTVAPIFAHQLAGALGLDIGSETRTLMRPFFEDAIEHLNRTADQDVAQFRHPKLWEDTITSISEHTIDPRKRDAFVDVLKKTVRNSEPKTNDGFGNGSFRGHARSTNAFHLISAYSSARNDQQVDAFLDKSRALFDQGIRGAVVTLAHDVHLTDDNVRRNSAVTEEKRLLVLNGFADAARSDSNVLVAMLPTDRSHGKAGTKTPDYYVKREKQGSLTELFVDAKARSHFAVLDRDDTGVEQASLQVFGHQFGQGDADGMVMLRVYGGQISDREVILDKIQRDLDAQKLTGGRQLWVQVEIAHADANVETVMLTPSHSKGQAPLPPAIS